MASPDKDLEKQLIEAGNGLHEPPSSVEELLSLLDKVEGLLASVEQTPPKVMRNAVSPSLEALVGDKLFGHSNVDVRVAVASCISEITRITAPDAPYCDEQMKEVFKLIVSTFEDLPDTSSRSYAKRVSVLETVAKVRSCVVMLDLDCDALIIQMFQLFLKAIRDYHPETVFSSMETIMTLVVEEIEDISPEILSILLASLRKDNKEVLPISRKLAENVVQSCATKLRPFLIQAVTSLGISLDDCCDVVASICHEASGASEQNEVTANEHPVNVINAIEATQSKQVHVPGDGLCQAVSNGVTEAGKDEPGSDASVTKEQEHKYCVNQPMDVDDQSNAAPHGKESEKAADEENGEKQITDKGGNKSVAVKERESLCASPVDGDAEGRTLPESTKCGKSSPVPPSEDTSGKKTGSVQDGKEEGSQFSTAKEEQEGLSKVPSPSRTGSLSDIKAGPRQKKAKLGKEIKPTVDDASQKASEEAREAKDRTLVIVNSPKKGISIDSDSEEKPLKQLGKKRHAKSDSSGKSSEQKDEKKQFHRKVFSKVAAKTPAKDDDKIRASKATAKPSKGENGLVEASRTYSKRKRTPSTEKASDDEEYGKSLLGARIKVWWPLDKQFYKGVIDSYDSAKKKHLVLYDDGDQEILNLKKERWVLIEGDSKPREEEVAQSTSPDASSGMRKHKKAKMIVGQSRKQGMTDASAKRSGVGSSSKSKAAPAKSGKKSKDDEERAGSKGKESFKTVNKSEEDSFDEDENQGNKANDAAFKLASKTKKVKNEKVDAKSSFKSKEALKSSELKQTLSETSGSKVGQSGKKSKDDGGRAESKGKESSKTADKLEQQSLQEDENRGKKPSDAALAIKIKRVKTGKEGGKFLIESKETLKSSSSKTTPLETSTGGKVRQSAKKSKDDEESPESKGEENSKTFDESEKGSLEKDGNQGSKSSDVAFAGKTKKVKNVNEDGRSSIELKETLKSSKLKQTNLEASSGCKGKESGKKSNDDEERAESKRREISKTVDETEQDSLEEDEDQGSKLSEAALASKTKKVKTVNEDGKSSIESKETLKSSKLKHTPPETSSGSKGKSGKKSEDDVERAECKGKESSKTVDESQDSLEQDENLDSKSIDAASKLASKARKVKFVKEDGKSSIESKETPKSSKPKLTPSETSSDSKGKKTPRSAGKSIAKTSDKVKSVSSKGEKEEEGEATGTAKGPEKIKGKSLFSSSKTKGNEYSTGKRRKR